MSEPWEEVLEQVEEVLRCEWDRGLRWLEAAPRRPAVATAAAGDAGLAGIAEEVRRCRACELHRQRRRAVPGEGPVGARIAFVGEGPGAREDATGRPFVGRAGELLTRIIQAMGLRREEVFIGNVVKCRPPGNRTPTPQEAHQCAPFLWRQLRLVRPRIVVALGRPAAGLLLQTNAGIRSIRGRLHRVDVPETGRPGPGRPVEAAEIERLEASSGGALPLLVMPTYHPAYLLRNPAEKRPVWEDMKRVMALLERQG